MSDDSKQLYMVAGLVAVLTGGTTVGGTQFFGGAQEQPTAHQHELQEHSHPEYDELEKRLLNEVLESQLRTNRNVINLELLAMDRAGVDPESREYKMKMVDLEQVTIRLAQIRGGPSQ